MSKTRDNRQLDAWTGDFGDAYTDRNKVDPRKRVAAFKRMLEGLDVKGILEVGCNRGHNLEAIGEALGKGLRLAGVEPNQHALKMAQEFQPQTLFMKGDAYALPFDDKAFDLVFTAGVLIHIPTEKLRDALVEIHRVSSKYILCIEYFAENDEEICYRGKSGLLWKRNFGALYQLQFHALKLIRSGYWSAEDGFDRTHWWLFEKG